MKINNFVKVKIACLRIINTFKFEDIQFNIAICVNVCLKRHGHYFGQNLFFD